MCNYTAYRRSVSLTLLFLICCGVSTAHAAMALHSSAFAANGQIPTEFTCAGEGKSPALAWSGVPPSAKSLALIMNDPDAPMGNFVHWVIFNIAPSSTGLPEGVPVGPETSFGAIQGHNGSGAGGYYGPCPPPGNNHHYHFRLYALDRMLALTSYAGASQVQAAMRGHVVGEAELIGIFARSFFP
jgi:Raf kinase inhibitor-like YbhB/YbcL family protein